MSRLIITRRTIAVNRAWKLADQLDSEADALRADGDCDLLNLSCELARDADDLRAIWNNERAPTAQTRSAS